MNIDRPLKEESISEMAVRWRLCSKNFDMEFTEGCGTSWSTRRYVEPGMDCAFVVAEEHLFGQPGQGWSKNEYEYWYIDKRVTKKGVRIDYDRYSPFANWCKEERYWIDVSSPEEALDYLLNDRFECNEAKEREEVYL